MGRLQRQGVSCRIKMPAFGGAGSFLARDVTVSPPGHVAKLSTPFDHIWPRPDHMHRDTVRHGLWVYMAVRDIMFKCTEKYLLCSRHLTVYTYLWFKIDVEAIMINVIQAIIDDCNNSDEICKLFSTEKGARFVASIKASMDSVFEWQQ